MAEDFFGYDKKVEGGGVIATSEFAAIHIDEGAGGAGEVTLAQSVSVNYQQQIKPIYVLGSSAVYWNAGFSQGTVQASRALGEKGFFEIFKGGGACAEMGNVTISSSGDGSCGKFSGKIKMTNCIVQNYSFQTQAQQLSMMESMTIQVGNMLKPE